MTLFEGDVTTNLTSHFTCAECGGTFPETKTEKEAEAELAKNFGLGVSKEECSLVCEDCYQEILARNKESIERGKLTWRN